MAQRTHKQLHRTGYNEALLKNRVGFRMALRKVEAEEREKALEIYRQRSASRALREFLKATDNGVPCCNTGFEASTKF